MKHLRLRSGRFLRSTLEILEDVLGTPEHLRRIWTDETEAEIQAQRAAVLEEMKRRETGLDPDDGPEARAKILATECRAFVVTCPRCKTRTANVFPPDPERLLRGISCARICQSCGYLENMSLRRALEILLEEGHILDNDPWRPR